MTNKDKTSLLNEAYKNFKEGQFEKAYNDIHEVLHSYYNDNEILLAFKSATFWKDIEQKLENIETTFKKGDILLSEWESYNMYLSTLAYQEENCKNSIKQWCFSTALSFYEHGNSETKNNNPKIIFAIGRCKKCIGKYEEAAKLLDKADNELKDDSEVIAELADACALIGETKNAKLLFKDAFFINPSKIKLAFLESSMITRLVSKILEKENISNSEIKEWIPVYGVLYGVFNETRQLKSEELGKLQQSILSYERRLESMENKKKSTIPRLISYYFRLIDHYKFINCERGRVDEVLEKIKQLNKDIYEDYIK